MFSNKSLFIISILFRLWNSAFSLAFFKQFSSISIAITFFAPFLIEITAKTPVPVPMSRTISLFLGYTDSAIILVVNEKGESGL